MSILKILYYPDIRLRNIANTVSTISKKTEIIIQDMFDTMYFLQGIGLAATQVNIHQKIIVIDLYQNNQKSLVLINPTIVKKTGSINMIEGCLSIPGVKETIVRSEKIIVQYLNQDGNNIEIEATGLLSVCIQHEIDHLLGKLFIDYLSPLKVYKIQKKIKKWMKKSLKKELYY